MPDDSTQDELKERYRRYAAGWDENTPDAAVNEFAPGGTYMDPSLEEPLEGEEIGEFIAEVNEGFPDLHFEFHRLLTTDEEGVLVVEWTMHGTHEGTLDGLPPTGETVALDGVDVVTFSDEGITSVRGYFNESDFAEQLGLDFPAVIGKIPTLTVGAIRNAF